jgi:hypothetical protein
MAAATSSRDEIVPVQRLAGDASNAGVKESSERAVAAVNMSEL